MIKTPKLAANLLFGLAAATASLTVTVSARAADLVIGEIHPITGPAAFYGLPESQAIKAAADEINTSGGVKVGGTSYQIVIKTADDQASPTVGVAALRKLLGEGAKFIIGPIASGVAPALKPIIESRPDVVQLIDGSIADGLTNGKTIFRNQASVQAYNDALTRLTKARAYPTVAIMTDRFHAGFMGSQKPLVDALDAQGNKVVAQEYHKLNDTDFSAQLTKIASMKPSALVLRGYPAEGALITKTARQLGYQGQVIWEFVSPPSTVLKNISPSEMDGVLNAIPPTSQDYVALGKEKALKLEARLKKMFNAEIGELSTLSYDAVYIFKAAIEKAGTLESAAVAKAFTQLKTTDVPMAINPYVPGADGLLFTDGQVGLPGGVQIWKGNGWQPLANLKPN
jgi:branched-chain amino acid transport system substrate-binding protein